MTHDAGKSTLLGLMVTHIVLEQKVLQISQEVVRKTPLRYLVQVRPDDYHW